MPSVTYNGQSFAIDGRRVWILAASIQYARIPAALWSVRIAAAKQAGFNTIETACPWAIHEPRKGRFHFQGDADLKRFVSLCGEQGMRVILRAGPYVGGNFDGGGLPGWLLETPGVVVRENNEQFLEHVSRYFRKLLGEVSDLQATSGGPILLVQSEHAWTCSNESQSARYLHEITRILRESGINVPILNSNDLWVDSPDTIDTWRGYDDLLVHLRQLRSVQPNAPRLVSTFDAACTQTWGQGSAAKSSKSKHDDAAAAKSPAMVLRHLAAVLAAGAQPVVSPFHGGTNFGFLGGRLAGGPDRFITTSAAAGAPLGEAGSRGEKYRLIKRLMTFANHFGHLFAELDPDFHPSILDPNAGSDDTITAPVQGSQGGVVFVFAGRHAKGEPMLILDNGVRLPVHLGSQSVAWFAMDVDLQGSGRLDYSNIMPWAIVDRSIVVFFGPAKAGIYLSINGLPLEGTIPTGAGKPLVLQHSGLTVVVCNEQQIDAAYHDDHGVHVGVAGLDGSGRPVPAPEFAKSWTIRSGGTIDEINFAAAGGAAANSARKSAARDQKAPALRDWRTVDLKSYVSGESPRFASLEGPTSLSGCGAPNGYGWYRMTFDAAGRKLCHLPESADRLQLFMGGKPVQLMGVGPGAVSKPLELSFEKGTQAIVALADNLGRFAEGNDLAEHKGIWGHLQQVKPLKTIKPKPVTADPVDPFSLRGLILGRSEGQLSESQQVSWTFEHTRKTPIVVDVGACAASGTFVLNNQPLAYFAGATGACAGRMLIDPKSTESFKRGKNVLRFAPDIRQTGAIAAISSATVLYECVETLTLDGGWAFAKWEPPAAASFKEIVKGNGKSNGGLPCWWKGAFELPRDAATESDLPLWLDVSSLSKGQVFVNDQNIGRYFTATATGKAVGPQTLLHVPAPWLRSGAANDLVIFDEHGFAPSRVRLVRADRGPLDLP